MLRCLLATFMAVSLLPGLRGQEIGFAEDFALAKDRLKTLQSLVPGTDDAFFYTALHRLNTEQYDAAAALFEPWLKAHGQTARLSELQFRHALLTHDRDPAKTYDFLIRHYGYRFDHQRPFTGGSPNLPTALDPKRIARETLRAQAFAQRNLVNPFEDSALTWLGNETFTDHLIRRNFLQRLTRPDLPTLPKLIADDLVAKDAGPFGSIGIHHNLTTAQLDELVKLRPELIHQGHTINLRLLRLHPGADEDWRREPKAYFERLEAYVETLPPVANPLKAHVLYHRLAYDRSRGTFDKPRFLKYLALPRGQGYMANRMLVSEAQRLTPATLDSDFGPFTLLPPVRGDEPIVRSFLKHFLADADSPREFEPFISDSYLRELFAETKIELGRGEPERWAAMLSPETYAALKDRIDLDFAPTNKTNYAADEAVKLTLNVKNIPTLIVKVFEINAANYYREFGKEVETDIALDGLVANSERTVTYAEAPARRVERTFDFPELTKPGVYVVDFIGGGTSSRALIRKGGLRPLVRSSNAGQALTIVDDANRPVPTATVLFGGKEYSPDKDGIVFIPFGTVPGRVPMVLKHGDFASLAFLNHEAESYSLSAGIVVDREQLIGQRLATVAVRPVLALNGRPVSLSILEQPKLVLIATDLDGVSTTSEVPIEKLFEDRETTHEFRVPPRLNALSIQFSAKVKSLTTGQSQSLAVSDGITVNGIAKSDRIEDVHFVRFGNTYALELLGRSGEVKADRPVSVSIKHRDFKQPVNLSLKTDANGRVTLGELPEITRVTATPVGGRARVYDLPQSRVELPTTIHAAANEPIAVPFAGTEPTRAELAFFRVTGPTIVDDLFGSLKVAGGAVTIAGLPAGDYELDVKRTGSRIRIRVTDGPAVNGYRLGRRHLETIPLKPVRIANVQTDGEAVVIKLADASKFARVHVIASRYGSETAPRLLGKVPSPGLRGTVPAGNDSQYLAGRNIGDEYRYVLDRRLRKPHAGNMLERPQLLLNPWAVRQTDSGEQLAKEGEAFGTMGQPKLATDVAGDPRGVDAAKPGGPGSGGVGEEAELDYLAESSIALWNLAPEADGTVTIRKGAFGSKSWLTIVAVDPLSATVTHAGLPEAKASTRDLRLRLGLDPLKHFAQQKQVTVVEPGKAFTLADAAGSRFEAYDSIAKLHSLYTTLVGDPRLTEFGFLKNWPTMPAAEKQTYYSRHACHELNFFIARKDKAFFDAVVKPYLANKKDKTFLDHYLIGSDLGEYAKPWQYARLNSVEKILLGKVLPAEAARTARFLADRQKLVPPNLPREQSLFEFAIKSSDLSKNSPIQAGLAIQVEMAAAGKAMPGIGGGGFGGGFGGVPGGGGLPPGGPVPTPSAARGGMGGPGMAPRTAAGRPNAPAMRDMPAKKDGDARRERFSKGGDGGEKQLEQKAQSVVEYEKAKAETFFAEDRKKLQDMQQILYRKVEPTSEWAENNYDKRRIAEQLADLVPVNPFWVDYANHQGDGPFLSKFVNRPGNSFTEAMFALAVTDLPFEAKPADVKFDAGKMTFTPAGPAIAFHEEVKPVGDVQGTLPILVSQNFYKNGDRYRDENGERLDKFVTDEFVVHTVYGMQVVVTNPSPSRQRLAVLVQIPVGALPLAGARPTKTILLDLEPYRTGTIDVLFYFPGPGSFAHFPVHVARNEQLVAAAKPQTFNVVAKATKDDRTSWDAIARDGSTDDVVAYLTRENVHALNLDLVAWRMADADAFDRIVTVLAERHVYQPTLWAYALKHRRTERVRDLLAHQKPPVGGALKSPLHDYDPVASHDYEHLEYRPLVNARAHALGKRRQIVNPSVLGQYQSFLHQLAYRKGLTDDDKLTAAYYLLLQDRVDEAGALFDEVKRDAVATKLQYDRFAAYLALSREEFGKARAVAQAYANHPVDRWRIAFKSVIDILDEAEGKAAVAADAEDRAQQLAKAAAKEPGFAFTIDNRTVQLTSQNLGEATVNIYPMDVELLFSRNPFALQADGQFSTIRPSKSLVVKVTGPKQAIELPAEYKTKNVLVEVTAAGKRQALPAYANAMTVTVIENFGQVKVVDAATGKPLSKVYVKAYVRTQDGQVKFHRDGYTDVRGRFDYATVSTPERSPAAKFAVLVLSDDKGAVIREATPPQP